MNNLNKQEILNEIDKKLEDSFDSFKRILEEKANK